MGPDAFEEIMKLLDQFSKDMSTSDYRALLSELLDEMEARWDALELDED